MTSDLDIMTLDLLEYSGSHFAFGLRAVLAPAASWRFSFIAS